MTAEQVFKLYRGYKFFYQGHSRFSKDGTAILTHPPLLKQFDRQYYHRISHKMSDAQIYALFTLGFFFNPTAHVSDLMTPAAQKAAFAFAGRLENGAEVLRSDLYDLGKRLAGEDLPEWLYGSDGSTMPPVLGDVINGVLPLDLACLLLLIPQQALAFDWLGYWAKQPDYGLGAHTWIHRLKKADQLIQMRHPHWRMMTHTLAREFWDSLGIQTLASVITESALQPSVF